jgi:hypothetical protein
VCLLSNLTPSRFGDAGHCRLSTAIERCNQEIATIEAQIRAGHPDLLGLCLGLADWSGELKLLLAAQTKEAAAVETSAANEDTIGGR